MKYTPNIESINLCIKKASELPDFSKIIELINKYKQELDEALKLVDLNPVIYDELEYFSKK